MAAPQTGIFALGTGSHAYLEFDLVPAVDAADAVSRVASIREPRTTIGGVNLVAGFRPELLVDRRPGRRTARGRRVQHASARPVGIHAARDPA